MTKRKANLKCCTCNLRKLFSTAKGLHRHYKKDHLTQCNVRCDNCFNYFENQTMLTMHLMGGCVLEHRDDGGDDIDEDSEEDSEENP